MDQVPEFYASRAKTYTDVLEFDKLMREQYLTHLNGDSNLLLSSESFLKFDPRLVKEKFSKYFDKIHIYIVVRPHVAWVESHYLQRMQVGRYKGSITDFLDKELVENPMYGALFLDRLYKNWIKVFRKQNVHFLYISRNAPPIEEQFLEALEIEIGENFDRLNRKINAAINPAFLPVILRLPKCSYVHYLELTKGLFKIWDEHPVDIKGSILSPDQRIDIQKRYLKSNQRFSKKNRHIPLEELCDLREEVPYLQPDKLMELDELKPFYSKAEELLHTVMQHCLKNSKQPVLASPGAQTK